MAGEVPPAAAVEAPPAADDSGHLVHDRPRLHILFGWIALAVVAGLALAWVFPRAYPLFPRVWEISKRDATSVALERLRDLGELPPRPYVTTRIDTQAALEHRLQASAGDRRADDIWASRLARDLMYWEVRVYERDARATDWSYQARLTPRGEIVELRLRVPAEESGGAIEPAAARQQADLFLREQGIELSGYEEPEVRRQQLRSRTDHFLRYRDREAFLGPGHPYGLEVVFAGDRLAGYSTYYDDPERAAIQSTFRPLLLLNQGWIFIGLLLLPLLAVPFVRLYHAGEIGVRRGLQIGLVVLACGVVTLFLCGRAASAGWGIGVLTRPQVTWVVVFQMLVLFFFPTALMAFLSWSVGESLTREHWSGKLAAFDALFRGDWLNATFAWATLRGHAAGLAILALLWLLSSGLRSFGAWSYSSFFLGPWWESAAWFSIPLVVFGIGYALYYSLFGQLVLVPAGVRWLGRWAGPVAAAVVSGMVFVSGQFAFPFGWNLLFWFGMPLALILVFLRYGLLTSFLAYLTVFVARGAVPFLDAPAPALQLQASLALLLLATPLIVSARYLLSDKRIVYRYEDIPPHVRRIAERERQKVELEMARGIQTSILPDLPPELHGVKLAHSYLPATEVGGDFYDVLALDDGRLAVAVGDVAGHGVSSGLVMSMAKSALAVQVTFDPEVEPVFTTLNRMVFQSARKRLLATLCYALIDPVRREMYYASAGHLFPYRVGRDGKVHALESVSYPLGVRDRLEVRVRAARLEAGDTLVLFSDGVVEARPAGSDELFGFERLEESLARHAGADVETLRDRVLEDLESFTGSAEREDDLTLLVLQAP